MEERLYLAFDLETVKPFPEGGDWREHRPLGIGCAAATGQDWGGPVHWCTVDPEGNVAERMSRDDLRLMVTALASARERGYTLLTWNGLGFDFDVLAEESGMDEECRDARPGARGHDVPHLLQDGLPGGPCGLREGHGDPGQDGGNGREAGDGDVGPGRPGAGGPLLRAGHGGDPGGGPGLRERAGKASWVSRAGRTNNLQLHVGWLTVAQALNLPEQDTSWMDTPIPRASFTGWLGPQGETARPVFRYPAGRS